MSEFYPIDGSWTYDLPFQMKSGKKVKVIKRSSYPYTIEIDSSYNDYLMEDSLLEWVKSNRDQISSVIFFRLELFYYRLYFKREEDLMLFKMSVL